ncbi:MAG: hypothetical protein ABSA46_18540 [Thermodesulfovibrionales bacterium]|jgi:hypothetical protein
MEKWKYKSLEWIHKAREANYQKTKNLSSAELIEKTRRSTDAAIKKMGLKITRSAEKVQSQ